MSIDLDIEPAAACIDAALLIDRVVVAVYLLLAHVEAGTGRANPIHRDFNPCAHIGLFGIVVAAVLLTRDGQIASDVGIHGVAMGLRTDEVSIPSWALSN